ncbi:MAG: ATP-binding protein, partial [Gilvibacter sp.]
RRSSDSSSCLIETNIFEVRISKGELPVNVKVEFIGDSIKIRSEKSRNSLRHLFTGLDSLKIPNSEQFKITDSSNYKRITLLSDTLFDRNLHPIGQSENTTFTFTGNSPFEILTSKIFVSIRQDELSLERLDSIFYKELDRRQLWITYGLEFSSPMAENEQLGEVTSDMNTQYVTAASSLLMHDSKIKVYFKNTTPLILHRNAVSLLLTFILIASIIGILFYMLRIIKQQKQLAEIKNDLISNITHEFKTPLATISVALEGIEQFNKTNDQEKTQKYAAMSSEQVKKLTHMVDKLLETASLDSQNLDLNTQDVDLVAVLTKLAVVPETFIHTQKQITFDSSLDQCVIRADKFHLENVLNTIVDNAFKYGGNKIKIGLHKDQNNTVVKIHDNGTSLTKSQTTKIFDKFYRVPKGNHHDTKGFGIGLYYAKNIIEKHNGTLMATINGGTTFTITLPNE